MTFFPSTPSSLPMEEAEPLAGTVKPYQQHLAVCTGGPPELWAARVEEMEGLFSVLAHALEAHGLEGIKLTACDDISTRAEGFDILLLPDMLRLPGITVEKVDKLANALQLQFQQGLPFDVEPMAGGDHIFVCVHANRDARCGQWGPLFYETLVWEVERQDAIAHVHQTSHIGGHRYAATCIVYPQGIWYGNLRPEDASRLVEQHINNERLLAEHYRGRLGTGVCQQVAEAEAARVITAAYPEYESLQVTVEEGDKQATAIARAVVPGTEGRIKIKAEFTLSCPTVWWSADDEPYFLPEV